MGMAARRFGGWPRRLHPLGKAQAGGGKVGGLARRQLLGLQGQEEQQQEEG